MEIELFEQLARTAQKYPKLPWRLLRNINVDGANGCWLWKAATVGSGYGCFVQKRGGYGKNVGSYLVHRIVYALINGPIAKGLVLDHLCGIRACCNPQHLEAVTPTENTRRGLRRIYVWLDRNECQRGHKLTQENVYLDPDGRRSCRTCRDDRVARFAQANQQHLKEYRKEYYQRPEVIARIRPYNRKKQREYRAARK